LTIDAAVEIRSDDGMGPAVTLDVKPKYLDAVAFSMDIVPAVIVMEWPLPAKNWTSRWLSRQTVSAIKEFKYHDRMKPFVVPKIHPSGTRIIA